MYFYNKKKQTKLQKALLVGLVAVLSLGLILPSFLGIASYLSF